MNASFKGLRLFFTMEKMLGFLGTMVLALPPILGVSESLNDGHVATCGSPLLLAREWTHEATKFLVELVKKSIESYCTAVFKQQHWERIQEQVIKIIQAWCDAFGRRFGTNGTSLSVNITRRMSTDIFDLPLSNECAKIEILNLFAVIFAHFQSFFV